MRRIILPKHLNRASKIVKASSGKIIHYNTEKPEIKQRENLWETAESFCAKIIWTK